METKQCNEVYRSPNQQEVCFRNKAMAAHWVVGLLAATVLLCSLQNVNSQIPAACADEVSLRSLTCCPNQCGASEGRGQCADLDLPANYSLNSTDVRYNWPHYFTRGCTCTGNYGGYDCSACKYGYYGTTCNQTQVLPRKSVQELTDSEWREYIEILNMTWSYNSGYKVVLGEYTPGTTNIDMSDVLPLYHFFVWQHHFAAKDTACGKGDNCTRVDYSHKATGFPTWHRHFILWFEWEVQQMLRKMGRENYYTFRTHYWDWRRDVTSHVTDEVFLENRLGVTRPNEAGQPQVYGDLYNNGWNTICWHGGSGNVIEPRGTICNPNVNTGPLLRCPFLPDEDPCNSTTNHDWPNIADVNVALSKPEYDTEPFNTTATVDSFRNFMEGNDVDISIEDCRRNRLCVCEVGGHNCEGPDASTPILTCLHNSVHFIVGIGYFGSGLQRNMTGVMADGAASPNDPLFINHHTMVDCILEEWLQGHPNAEYPNVPSSLEGHQKDAYIIPFYPLFKNKDMFKTADNFGYSCTLPDVTGAGCGEGCIIGIAIGSSLAGLLIVAIVAGILCVLYKWHNASYATIN